MKIMTIIGARPQFIKAAPFSKKFRQKHTEMLVHTGQHYDTNMSDIFFDELEIPKPDYNLGCGAGSHGEMTGKMLMEIEYLLLEHKPDALLVYGDTNSTLAGALAASKLLVPVIHVEAGLRSYNMAMPEEQNRVLTDHISKILVCPTQTAVENLNKEGIVNGVFFTGDIMYDAVLQNIEIAKKRTNLADICKKNFIQTAAYKEYFLATIHRAENTNDIGKLTTIFSALEKIGKQVIMPLHPRTKKMLVDNGIRVNNIDFIPPVGYLDMLLLIFGSAMIITDSGGLQKEAFFLNVPCTTLRDQTEWVETLENGNNVLAKIDCNDILLKVKRKCVFTKNGFGFGDGNAADKIIKTMEKHIN